MQLPNAAAWDRASKATYAYLDGDAVALDPIEIAEAFADIEDTAPDWSDQLYDRLDVRAANRMRKSVQRARSRRATTLYAEFADLADNPPPPRSWIVNNWLPLGTLVALFGAGGVGKSLLAQQLATCVANGVPVLGQRVQMGPVLGFMCEDDNDELRRRQASILSHLGRSAAYSSANLHLQGRAGLPNALIAFGPDRRVLRTALFDYIEQECDRLQPALLIVDNIAQVYAGIENDRHEVTAFCNELTGIARRTDCAVLLLGHVAKADGSEYSGSTAWEAAVRTRLWLERREDGAIELHRRKANYAARDSIVLEYRDGALGELDDSSAGAAETLMMAKAERDVLAALDKFTSRQVATSQSESARTYLPRMAENEGLLNGTPLPMAKRALGRLIDRGEIECGATLGWKKPDRHDAMGLARKRRIEAAEGLDDLAVADSAEEEIDAVQPAV